MSLFRFLSGGRPRNQTPGPDAVRARAFRPGLEVLEARDCPAITAPTGLSLTALSSTQVQIAWSPVAGDLGYQIFEWNGVSTIQIGQVTAKTTTFIATGLTPFHQYFFTVDAFDASTSATAPWVSIITPRTAITAPINVLVKATSDSQLTLTWSPATGETGYNILKWNGSSWVQVGSTVAGVDAFVVTGLSAGQSYSFEVQAFNATNAGTSAVITGSTPGVGLTAVGNLTAKAVSANAIQLNWTNSVRETSYRVYRWNIVTQTDVLLATLSAGTTTYEDTELLGSTTYWYYVQAFNAANFANSGWISATTPAQAPLTAPGNFTGVAVGTSGAKLTWSASAGVAGYRVFEWTGVSWELVTTLGPTATSTVVNNLNNNQTYWFLVQAFTTNNQQVADTSAVFVNV